ncbi:MAG: nitrilase-related carbon-nitrogen hydrolase, partial [Bacteroidota bacterium]|nr:nitrilase-related carbon-nitrogen hydrolase [Bacteroidota bacterium]
MKIAIAQLNYNIGDFEGNVASIINSIDKAKNDNVELIIFSELSVCGYPPQDLLEKKSFIQDNKDAIDKIAKECIDIAAIIGAPTINYNKKGKPLYNSALFLYEGEIQFQQNKSLLPTYDIFDEHRYFEPNEKFNIVEFKNKKIALTICEDLWDIQPVENSFAKSQLYNITPMEQLAEYNPDFVVNIAASPFSYTRIWGKKNIFMRNAKKYQVPIFYANQVGAQTELIFDGNSMVVNNKGCIIDELKSFAEDYKIYDFDNINNE